MSLTSFNSSFPTPSFSPIVSLSCETNNTSNETNSGNQPRIIQVPSKPLGFVIGEQLKNICDYICDYILSKMPSFPFASANPTSCTDPLASLEDYSIEDLTKCEIKGKAWNAEVGKYEITMHCPPINNKLSPEEANRALHEIQEKITVIEHQLRKAEIESQQKLLADTKEKLLEDQEIVIGRLQPGHIITVDENGKPLVITPENQAAHEKKYNLEAIRSFKELATATKGIMALSPSPEYLNSIVDHVFHHILYSLQPNKPVDMAIVLDTTHSMFDDIIHVQKNLLRFLQQIKEKGLKNGNKFKIAFLEYRDRGDRFVQRVIIGFTKDLSIIENRIKNIKVEGGGDKPEAVLDGLESAVNNLSWDPDAQKFVLLIGDAEPQPETISGIDIKGLLKLYTKKEVGIAIYPIVTNE